MEDIRRRLTNETRPLTPLGYQLRKARTIVAYLASLDVSHTRHQLAQCVALMTFDQWRTVAFSAGVPVVDLDAKAAVLALLRGRDLHLVR